MNLQKLISTRAAHRKVVEGQLNKITANLCSEEINAILDGVLDKIVLLKQLNEKILSQTDVSDIESEIIESEEYMMELESKTRKVRREFSHHNGAHKEAAPTESTAGCEENNNSTSSQHSVRAEVSFPTSISSSASQLRLPKLTLPNFSGNVLEWPTFWDSFESSIHLNSALPDIQKFSYLKSLTHDAAARAIDGFPLTNANYAKAIDLLRERFGQPHMIIHAYMQALLEMPRPSRSMHSLQAFYDNLETNIRGLESLGQSKESYGSLLVPVIIEKLPAEIRSNMTRSTGTSNWTIDTLRQALKSEIIILQAGYRSDAPDAAQSSTVSFHAGAKTGATHPYKKDHKSSADRRNQEKKCQFCGGKHLANECTKVTAVSARKEIVKQKHLCFNCLGNHLVSSCRSTNRCRTCHKKHHSSICEQLNVRGQSTLNATATNFIPASSRHTEESITVDRSNPTLSQNGQSAILHSVVQEKQNTFLKTAIAQISSQTCRNDVNILFDEGSQRSFITKDMADKIQLERNDNEEVHIAAFGASTQNVRHFDTATVWLHADNGEKIPINVLVVPTIAVPLCNLQKAASSLSYLQGLKLAHPPTDSEYFEIELLIGADNYWSIVQNRIIRGFGPTAVQSKIGFLLSGPLTMKSKSNEAILNVIASPPVFDLQRFWDLESIGICTPKDENTVASQLREYQETSIEFKDGRYSTKLPWKDDHPPLPDNFSVARRRTQNTIKRLQEQPSLFQKYGEIITEQEKRGFIEKVNPAEPVQTVHYIPHREVIKESATTPVRIVYDCSCRQSRDAPSLNDCLKSTPPDLNDLTSILMRFRLNPYAVSTDIEKAFLHVQLDEKDRDLTRFLWLSDPNDSNSELTSYRFKTILFGATCSPFILNATLLKHLQDHDDVWVSERLRRDLYVDNIISSFSTETQALSYFQDVISWIQLAFLEFKQPETT